MWEELACITPTTQCTCGESKEAANTKMGDQLMQFLMGLHDDYDHVRNQILMMIHFLALAGPFYGFEDWKTKGNKFRAFLYNTKYGYASL